MLGTILYPYILIYNILMFLLVSYSLKSSSCSCNSISISSHFCPQSVIFSTAIYLQVGGVRNHKWFTGGKADIVKFTKYWVVTGCAGIDPWIVLTLRIISHRVGSLRGACTLHSVCLVSMHNTHLLHIWGCTQRNVCVRANTPYMNVEAQ